MRKVLAAVFFFATAALAADKQFQVTTASDFGAGSFRAVIETVNAGCAPTDRCTITFAGPMTIEPQSPLPAIEACAVIIDGGIDGPSFDVPRPVVLSGGKLAFGNGLELRPRCTLGTIEQHTWVSGLAIGSFPENGIVIAVPPDAIAVNNVVIFNFIGTDATGTIARPNGLRGIAIETARSDAEISQNVISGNARSGIAIWNDNDSVARNGAEVNIFGNRIGLSSQNAPLGNGASGVFINAGAASLQRNAIAYNRDFGVAMFPRVARVIMWNNSLHDNGQFEIDWNLDKATANETAEAFAVPGAPQILDAYYDAARNQTLVHGVLADRTHSDTLISVDIFASDPGPHSQAETYLTSVVVYSKVIPEDVHIDAPFDVVVNGDWRGKVISGQTVTSLFPDFFPDNVSELGNAVPVR